MTIHNFTVYMVMTLNVINIVLIVAIIALSGIAAKKMRRMNQYLVKQNALLKLEVDRLHRVHPNDRESILMDIIRCFHNEME